MNFTPENGSTLQVVGVGENRIGTDAANPLVTRSERHCVADAQD